LGFQPTTQELSLLDADGTFISSDELDLLYQKVRAYERIAARALDREHLQLFLRIDEARFLLNELAIPDKKLNEKLYHRLRQHVDHLIKKGNYAPLQLPNLLARSEFVGDYLQTNIGHPEETENYFNKLREMIQQIDEQTEYVEVPSYMTVLQTLLQYASQYQTPNIAYVGLQNYCLIRSGFKLLDPQYHHFYRDADPPDVTIIQLNNHILADLIKHYNSLFSS